MSGRPLLNLAETDGSRWGTDAMTMGQQFLSLWLFIISSLMKFEQKAIGQVTHPYWPTHMTDTVRSFFRLNEPH